MRSTESNNTHGSFSFSLSARREPDPCFNLIEILSWPVCQLDKLLQSPPHITHFASFAGQIIREPQFGDLAGSWGIYYLFSSLVLRGADMMEWKCSHSRWHWYINISCMMQNFYCNGMKRQISIKERNINAFWILTQQDLLLSVLIANYWNTSGLTNLNQHQHNQRKLFQISLFF